MNALICHRTGPDPTLSVEDTPALPLRPGCVRIRVAASGINPADAMQAAGTHQNTPVAPFTPGFECAGTVIEAAPSVAFSPGAMVVAAVSYGAHASEIVVDVRAVAAAPISTTLAKAAAMPVRYGTSLLALRERACLRPGEWVLVTGAAGKVGSAAAVVARRLGARVIALVRSEHSGAVGEWADRVATRLDALPDVVREATGNQGVNVVFDTVNGPAFPAALDVLAPLGRYLPIGVGSGEVRALASLDVLARNVSLVGVDFDWHLRHDLDAIARTLTTLSEWWSAGPLPMPDVRERPLVEGPRVLRELAAGRLLPNTVLTR